jgi:Transglycosylase SLT domain
MRIKAILSIISVSLFASTVNAQIDYRSLLVTKTVLMQTDTIKMQFVKNDQLFLEKWDTLPQPLFWKQVINQTPDSCILNIAGIRKPLHKICAADWHCQTETEKLQFKEFTCQVYDLPIETNLYVTAGKKDFYEYKQVLPLIDKAIDVFIANETDPWYAQSILLIESPGRLKAKSSVGANGPFQLMRNVAVMYGLRVNKKMDERTNLNRAAMAAAKLLKNAFIPKVKALLDGKNIAYNETDLWFRLLVLHAYHAGPGNVACVINQINPDKGGVELLKQMWQTECGGFKNESQNYSQIALANILIFDGFVNRFKDSVYTIDGDRQFTEYKKSKLIILDEKKINDLSEISRAYGTDLIDGTITSDYFIKKINLLNKELTVLKYTDAKALFNTNSCTQICGHLIRKGKLDDAEKILKLNIQNFPECFASYDSLSRVCKLQGKKVLADEYQQKSKAIRSTLN